MVLRRFYAISVLGVTKKDFFLRSMGISGERQENVIGVAISHVGDFVILYLTFL